MWNLPIAVEIDGVEYPITNRCDYRMVLDVICALNDSELGDDGQRIKVALYVFYEDISACPNLEKAVIEMYKIIGYGEDPEAKNDTKPRLMDWKHDFQHIAPPVSRVLGWDIRDPDRYCHYWTFLGGYMEIGECFFNNVVSIRSKRMKGKKLENWEQEFYRENKKLVDLPHVLTEDEIEWLDSE